MTKRRLTKHYRKALRQLEIAKQNVETAQIIVQGLRIEMIDAGLDPEQV